MKYLTLSLLVALSTVGGVYAEDLIQMRFPQLRVQEIIEYYRHLTGAHVITDSQVTGLMSLETLEPVSRAKAIELIETALFANGFSIIQPQPDTIQIIGLGRSARSEALPLLTAPEQLPTGERICTYLFKLKNREPAEISKFLKNQYLTTISQVPYILTDPKSGSVVVTARSTVLLEMIRLVNELDVAKPK